MKDFIAGVMLALVAFMAWPAHATIDVTLQMQLGNPSGASAETNNLTHFLIQRPIEAMDYNDTLGEPNWASWDLTAADANGAVNRQDRFATDTNLPPNFHRVGPNDYTDSGYERGHLCPSADRTDNTNDNDMTFLMSNMMPQTAANNSGTWANFEDYCRALARTNELLIICGPSGFTGAKINTNGYVWIPQYTWKIAVVTLPGTGPATNRITATNRVIAIKVPNTNGVSSVWQNFITSANQIQVDTGLTFFTALPADVADALRSEVDGETNLPPVIFSFSPTNGAAGTNVVITGANLSLASAVTFNGVSASYAVNSSNQITAIVPTNAGSGSISVTTPGGTAISTNRFTVNGGGVNNAYSGVLSGWDVSAQNNFGPSPLPPTTTAPNVAVGGLTRGAGVKTLSTGAAGGWGGNGFTNVSAATAIASNQYVTFSLTASNGYRISYTNISRFDYRRTSTGPTNGLVQFQVGNSGFTDVTNLTYSAASNGATNNPIDLSGYAALQNVRANTTVSFRIVNYNAGGASGNWYVWDTAGSTALDLAVQGTVAPVITPGFQSFVFAPGNVSLVITGGTAASYTIYATTNLANPEWTALLSTNPLTLPFTFVDTNQPPQRYYRVESE